MSKAVLDPARATSSHTFRVRFCETDLMGIVHHANYLVYFEAGRVEWLRRRGIVYANWAANGVHTAVVEATTRYRLAARFDEELTCETTLSELGSVSLVYSYRLLRGDALIATGHTKLACVDDAQKLTKVTPEMRAVMLAGELPR
jgi:acyl-CoA thioester hydrolase